MTSNDTDVLPTDTDFISEDVFAVLGNELRLEILWALYRAWMQGSSNSLSFSDLHNQLTEDISGSQLNYHLQQFVGNFVEKREERYRIRPAGMQICQALIAGRFSTFQDRGQTAADAGFDCHYCQTRVEGVFEKETARITCPGCEYIYTAGLLEIPQDAFGTEEELLTQFGKYVHCQTFWRALGICTTCGSQLDPELCTPNSIRYEIAQRRNEVEVDRSCEYCSTPSYHTLGTDMLADPGLISFCYEHGVNLLSPPVWHLEFIWTDKHVSVRSIDPWEVALHATLDGETLEIVVDGNVNVIERNRIAGTATERPSLVMKIQNDPLLYGLENTGGNGGEVSLPDHGDCLQVLRRHRWPNQVTCPLCESADTIKKGRTGKDAQRYKCHNCNSYFNDLTGTLFAEHGLSLQEMFHIILKMDGTSSAQIARQLDRSYQSILDFVHEAQENRGKELGSVR